MADRNSIQRVVTYVGADGRTLSFTAKTSAGAVYPLTSLTVTLTAEYPSGTKKIDNQAVTIVDAAAGTFTYTPTAAQINVKGIYTCYVKLVNASLKVDYLEGIEIEVREPGTRSTLSLSIDADPIIGEADVRSALGVNEETAILLINSVSAKFRQYTNRLYINRVSADITELFCGDGTPIAWLHATPVKISGGTVVVTTLSQGATVNTYTLALSQLAVDATSGRLTLLSADFPYSETEENCQIVYQGGWTAVPGDITSAALEQMRVEKARMEGLTGITNISRDGQSVGYESGGLIKSVREAWNPYRMFR